MKSNLIEKYIYAVTSKLPVKMKKDVGEELRTNIWDMLPDDYTEKDVEKVLTELGNPSNLANNYTGNKNYLISPKLYYFYMRVLKLVLVIVCIIFLIGFPISQILEFSGETAPTAGRILLNTLGTISIAFAITFTSVTVIFAIIDKKIDEIEEEWTVKGLEDIPEHAQNKNPNKYEGMIEIALAIIPAIIVGFSPNILGWYDRIEGSWEVIPVFSEATLSSYMPLILITTFFVVAVIILKMVNDKWNTFLAIANAISNILVIIASTLILTSTRIFNSDFVDRYNSEVILNESSNPWRTTTLIILVIITAISIIEMVNNVRKLRRKI